MDETKVFKPLDIDFFDGYRPVIPPGRYSCPV